MSSIQKEETLNALLEQFQLINRINTALSSSLKLEDIFSIILAALVARNGLGFSRAIIIRYDSTTHSYCGYRALGCLDAEESERMREEMQTEFDFINNALEEFENGDVTDKDSEENYFGASLTDLRSSALWITSFQKFGQGTPLDEKISSISISHNVKNREASNCVTEAIRTGHVLICNGKSEEHPIPAELRDVLDDSFLVAPLKTKKSAPAVIIVDKKFEDRGITQSDLRYLEWFLNQASLFVDNAELFEDLQHTYEELKQMDNLKTNFLSIISHELRTPLTAILGFTDLLINEKVGNLTPAQTELLERVVKNTHHLTHIVNDLIEVTHIQAGETTGILLGKVDPLSILMSVQPKLTLRRREKKVSIEPIIPDFLPNINCNSEALEKIYFHLLDNAVKFSSENSMVEVTFTIQDKNLHISIIDHGIGIPEDRLQSIFELFYQVDNRLSRSHEGLGLGLTITQMLISSTGGQLDVKSQVGKGSVFTIIYPIVEKSKTSSQVADSSVV